MEAEEAAVEEVKGEGAAPPQGMRCCRALK